MYHFETNFPIANEIEEEIRQFAPYLNDDASIVHRCSICKNVLCNEIVINEKSYFYRDSLGSNGDNDLTIAKNINRHSKHSVYMALRDYTSRSMPWGSLTGIRPTKLAYEYLGNAGTVNGIADFMSKKYDVLPNKAKIIQNIVLCQREYLVSPEEYVNFYVHIPFCTTKCSYCSFTTHIADKSKKIIGPYVDCLISEIEHSLEMIKQSGKKIFSVYIGGGTPTALPDERFEKVLSALADCRVEFTCEAGRPDTITESKAEIMKQYGVTRVCVNPQTLNNDTLVAIGRRHTAEDFFVCYEMIKKFGFDINVDLIAGLPGETDVIFNDSVAQCALLVPDNVTVHTLSVKNGSELKNAGTAAVNPYTEKMVDAAYSLLTSNGYSPYYLYRQKNMMGNLENVGYSLPGKICVNNVTTMEETLSVVACGAGAISKRLFSGGRIERLANLRDAELYVRQFDDRLKKKLNFFTKQA